jgi:hypothetical protein
MKSDRYVAADCVDIILDNGLSPIVVHDLPYVNVSKMCEKFMFGHYTLIHMYIQKTCLQLSTIVFRTLQTKLFICLITNLTQLL